jgi:8-oxo-dGTP pyrophosphatase MutT (NUDIX family)
LENTNNIDFNRRLKEILTQREIVRIKDDRRKPSAVLIPMYYSEEQHHLIFTKRTELVSSHKGEISFPGGGYHQGDSNLVTTALRETWEEIGLAPEDVKVLGQLDDRLTKGSAYIITPFVGIIPAEYKFRLNSFETAEVFQIPVPALLDISYRREEPETLEGQAITTYFYSYQNHTIIGATARILKQFLDIYAQVVQDMKTG